VKNAERMASERRFRTRLAAASVKRAAALAFYEGGNGRTTYDVAAEFGCSKTFAGRMLILARNERDYRRIHEEA